MNEPAGNEALAALFGAAWTPLPVADPGEEGAVAASVARGEGGSHFVVVQSQREAMVGSVKGKFEPGTRLAGQLLASVIGADEIATLAAQDMPRANTIKAQTMMFVGQHVGEARVVVAVLNGVPVLDFVGVREDALQHANGFIENVLNGGVLLIQRDVEPEFHVLATSAPAAVQLVDGLLFDAKWRTRTQPLRPVGVSRARLALAGGLLFAAVLPAGMYGYRRFAQNRMERMASEQAAAVRASAAGTLQRLQSEALGAVTLAQAGAAGKMTFDFARRLRDNRAGFALDKLTLTPKEALASYSRANKQRTFKDFVAQPDPGTPAFDAAKLDAASVSYDALPWQQLPTVDLINPQPGSAVLLEMGSLAQRVEAVNIKLAISAAAAVLTTEQTGRVEQGVLARIGRKAGAWTSTGPVDLFLPLMEALPAQACTLSQVEFRWAKDQQGVPTDTFTASGRWIVGWA